MKYNRKMEWTTHLGNTVTVEGMADEHIANTIQFLTHYKVKASFLELLKKEAKRRRLTKAFLARAQIPYKDGRGNWIVWDFVSDRAEIVGSYKRG